MSIKRVTIVTFWVSAGATFNSPLQDRLSGLKVKVLT